MDVNPRETMNVTRAASDDESVVGGNAAIATMKQNVLEEPAKKTPSIEIPSPHEEQVLVDDAVETEGDEVDAVSRGTSADSGLLDTSDDMVLLDEISHHRAEPPPRYTSQIDGVAVPSETSAPALSVTPQRKEELLLQARADRILWIQKVPLPYRRNRNTATDEPRGMTTFLADSHVATQMPAISTILQHLYDKNTDRIEELLANSSNEHKHVYLTGNQILKQEIATAPEGSEQKEILLAYQSFLQKLQDPVCGVLVQGIRNFCWKLQDVDTKEEAAERLKSYAAATHEAIKQHVAFQHYQENMEEIQRSLGSFLLGQCRNHVEKLFWTPEAVAKDRTFHEKLLLLQFITPTHLDIVCLADAEERLVKELLELPIKELLAVDAYHSVYEKLQRILALFRSVNNAIKTALNRHDSENEESTKKLPSADDILPTMILTVLRAQPDRLHFNLSLISEFSPHHYLRGEAGYAYTNLYGAVQFLDELNIESGTSNLSISPEAFREGVASYREKMENQLNLIKQKTAVCEASSNLEKRLPSPSPLDIREARLRGEITDFEWALRWQETQGLNTSVDIRTIEKSSFGSPELEDLPLGFRRDYTFLTSRPDDIRISNLSQLLEEYRMLVHTTEKLIAERSARIAAERKAKNKKVESSLLASAQGIDPALFADKIFLN